MEFDHSLLKDLINTEAIRVLLLPNSNQPHQHFLPLLCDIIAMAEILQPFPQPLKLPMLIPKRFPCDFVVHFNNTLSELLVLVNFLH